MSTQDPTLSATEGIDVPVKPIKPRRKFIGTSTPKASSSKIVRRVANQIPDDILHDAELNAAIQGEGQPPVKLLDDSLTLFQLSLATTTSRSTRPYTIFDEMESKRWPCRCQRD